jgi:hypothetical protein
MKKLVLASIVLQALLASSAHAALQDPNTLLSGYSTLKFYDYENIYDPTGTIVPVSGAGAATAQVGDSIEGVFVVTSMANQGGASYVPQVAGNVEFTGVFDEYVAGIVGTGSNAYYILTPDTTSVVGQKAISGAQFQSTYGSGSMVGIYYNNNQNIPIGTVGNGFTAAPYNSVSGAWALATSGTKYISFGAPGLSASWGSNYYWAANQTAPGTATFGASLQIVQNLTGIPNSLFGPVFEPPPQNAPLGLTLLPGQFSDGGTTYIAANGGLGLNTVGTPFNIFSSDPAAVDVTPEPTGILVVGGLFGLWGLGLAFRRRMRQA